MTIIKRTILLLVAIIPLAGIIYLLNNEPYTSIPDNIRVDKVVVCKQKRLMRLVVGEEIFREYKIALGGNPEGHKTCEGDEKTPEGIYRLDDRDSTGCYFLRIISDIPISMISGRRKKSTVNPAT